MAAYPAEYELDLVLRDGGMVQVRPIKPDDGERLVRFFEHLSPESRYFRFFRVKDSLEPSEVEYFTHVDYDRRMALVVLDGPEIVGVGRYDRLPDDDSVAEVAFTVVDSHQGRGIGTELLQLLTSHARSHDVAGFRAFVLPSNVQMMRVFRNSGYSMSRSLEVGVYTVDFPVAESEDVVEAAGAREKQAVAASILPLLFPRSVAVIGASNRTGSIGNRLFLNLLQAGFTGPLFPVNPNAVVVHSVRAYPSILDISDPVDLAFIVVPAPLVVEAARQCGAKGVRGLVVISAGFAETDAEGVEREAELVEVVRSAGMRMIGPNCMGVVNTSAAVRLNGTFAPVFPPQGTIAMSSQSGALGIAILDYARRTNVGVSQFVSVGNLADVSGHDLLLAWEDDPATDVILLYLESFGTPRKFSRIARRIGRRKPIVAVKSGRTGAGSRAASSHTGALASSDAAVEALFEQAGVIRTNTIEEQFAVASLLAKQPLPLGRRVGILTNGGGPGILAADALEANGLFLPELSAEVQARLRIVLPVEASTRNPVDTIASGGPDQYRQCLQALLESEEVDAVMVIFVPTTPEGSEEVAAALKEVMDEYEGVVPVLAVFMQQEAAPLLGAGRRAIPIYQFPEEGAVALSRAVRYTEWRNRDPGAVPVFPDLDIDAARVTVAAALERTGPEGGWLTAEEFDSVLSAAGIRHAISNVAADEDAAIAAAAMVGGPVALKVVAPGVLHKTEVGGVLLGLAGEAAVRAGFRQIRSAVPEAEGVIVQEMVEGGHEVLMGMVEDPNFGPLIVFGLGGVLVELLGDVVFRIQPLTDRDAAAMVRSIRGARLFDGYRNLPAGDVEAAEQTLLRLSALIGAVPELAELDLNPVKVLEPGKGVVVVDGRARIRHLAEDEALALADLPSVPTRRR
ncbi:MAG TPA: GNAT family N-acetyltransferase [Acidimicrobiia bacterium]|jgi:acetyl coenzyme A synthetase (ADP forming)-like protein